MGGFIKALNDTGDKSTCMFLTLNPPLLQCWILEIYDKKS